MSTKKPGVIPIDNINKGGLSSSKWSGIQHSLYRLIGFDPHSLPGIIQVEQKMTKNSSTTVTELCRVAVNASNGAQYWFSYTSGKIWEQPVVGPIRLVYTTTPATGNAGCLGAAEYEGYIYWATQYRVHRITVSAADDNNWVTDAEEDWATFETGDSDFHPMFSHPSQLILYIGDGNKLAQVDGTTFSANALDIKTPLRIKSIGQIGTDVLLGTYVADTVTETEIIRWNGWSVSFTNSDTIPEVGINAFFKADNMVLVQAGNQGNIYYYDGTNLELFSKIPGEYTSSAYGEVYPDSVANKNGQMLFGFSNGSGNPAPQGIYRIARHDRNYPYIMDLPYPISERSGGEFVTSGIQIGAVLVVGNDIYVAWKNGSTYGIDKLDQTAKLDGAYFETRVVSVDRDEQTNFSEALVAYANLPDSTDINFYQDINYAGYGSAIDKITDIQRNIVRTKDASVEFTTMQLKVKITASGNTAPQIESAAIKVR